MTIPFAFQVPGSSAFGLQSQSRTLVYAPSTSPLGFLPGFLKCFGYMLGLMSGILTCCESYSATIDPRNLSQRHFYIKAGAGQMYKRSYLKYEDTYGLWARAAPKSDLITIVGIGYKTDDYFRADLELSYSKAKYSAKHTYKPLSISQDTSTVALMANGYYDFSFKSPLLPYVMAGVGVAHNNAHALQLSAPPPRGTKSFNKTAKKCWSIAWNVGAGLKYNIVSRLSLDIGYRYMHYGTVKMNAPSKLGWGKGKVAMTGHLFVLSAYCKLF